MTLQAILYHPASDSSTSLPSLQILDQLLLPHESTYITISTSEDAFHAIKSMRVRGAPAIAIVAALALAVEISALQSTSHISSNGEEVGVFLLEKLNYLLGSRPTAVNLGDAVRKLKAVVDTQVASGKGNAGSKDVVAAYVTAAEKMLEDDLADNQAIGKFGAEWILRHASKEKGGKVSVLTHCNTG
jgi:methylthioribose-1-phosphate isomerase